MTRPPAFKIVTEEVGASVTVAPHSTGLETIVKLDALGARDGFTVAVVRGPRAVERLFAVMQLDRRLRIVDDPGDVA